MTTSPSASKLTAALSFWREIKASCYLLWGRPVPLVRLARQDLQEALRDLLARVGRARPVPRETLVQRARAEQRQQDLRVTRALRALPGRPVPPATKAFLEERELQDRLARAWLERLERLDPLARREALVKQARQVTPVLKDQLGPLEVQVMQELRAQLGLPALKEVRGQPVPEAHKDRKV